MKRALLLLPLITACGAGDSVASDDFTYSDEGWILESEFGQADQSIVESDLGGNAPFICGEDRGFAGEGGFWGFRAPSKYLRNVSRAFGLRLTWYAMTEYDRRPGPMVQNGEVVLTGRGLALIAVVQNDSNRPSREWVPFSVVLDTTAGWRKQNGGGAATDDEIKSVLRDVSVLRLPGEWVGGRAEKSCLDDVYFGTP